MENLRLSHDDGRVFGSLSTVISKCTWMITQWQWHCYSLIGCRV